jgi:FtsH-binding integral membrane protein
MGMFDQENPYAYGNPTAVYQEAESERTAFIRRTYAHLAGAVALFIAIETFIFTVVPAQVLENMTALMFGGIGWLFILGGFMVISWIANTWAANPGSTGKQYAGLLLYVFAEAILFVPLLWIAQRVDPNGQMIPAAGLLTAIIFGGLTAMVFFTKADFSWLGRYLWLAGLLAIGLILCSIFFNLGPFGLVVIGLFIALASGYILYDTSNVLHHYHTSQHVAASLALFASVALLFWYVLQLVMSASRD